MDVYGLSRQKRAEVQRSRAVWFELLTQDIGAARRFYAEAFGFALQPMAEPMADPEQNANYVTNGPADEASSGICDVRGFGIEQDGSFWRVYFAVDGCDRAVERVRELGGRVTDGPMDSPFGRIATVEDPTGASFQIVSPSRPCRRERAGVTSGGRAARAHGCPGDTRADRLFVPLPRRCDVGHTRAAGRW